MLGVVYWDGQGVGVEISTTFFHDPSACLRQIVTALLFCVIGFPVESVYETCLAYKLKELGITVEQQRPIPLYYDSVKMDCGFRSDLIIENKLIIEAKSVDALNEIHLAQILTHLRLSNIKLGLLINFNVIKLKDGIRRVVNNL